MKRAIAIFLLVGFAACGGGKSDGSAATGSEGDAGGAAGSTSSSSVPIDGAPTPGGNGAPGAPPSVGGSGSPAPAPSTTGDRGSSAAPLPLPLEATLQFACLKPGDRQTVDVRTARGAAIAYDSRYSDGKTGISEGFYGGNKGGHASEEGTWSDTWVIAPQAPPGDVQVTIVAGAMGHQHAEQVKTYRLVGVGESCP